MLEQLSFLAWSHIYRLNFLPWWISQFMANAMTKYQLRIVLVSYDIYVSTWSTEQIACFVANIAVYCYVAPKIFTRYSWYVCMIHIYTGLLLTATVIYVYTKTLPSCKNRVHTIQPANKFKFLVEIYVHSSYKHVLYNENCMW